MEGYSQQIQCALKVGLITTLILSGCLIIGGGGPLCDDKQGPLWPDIDLSLYEAVTFHNMSGTQGLQSKNIRPSLETDYWEVFGFQSGIKCGTATDKELCRVEFDALRCPIENAPRSAKVWWWGPADALANDVVPYHMAIEAVVALNHGDENRILCAREGILEFFGTIDSKEEAALLLTKDGFYGDDEKTDGAVREINGEYEFIVVKNVFEDGKGKDYTSNRYLLRVLPSGAVSILREQLARERRCK